MNESNSDNSTRSADELAAQMLDAELSDREQADLVKLMSQDASACDRVVEHALIHALLRNELGGFPPDPLDESLLNVMLSADCLNCDPELSGSSEGAGRVSSVVAPISNRTGKSWLWLATTAIGGLAVGILLAVAAGWLQRSQVAQVPSDRDNSVTVTPIAFLTASNGCDWGERSATIRAVGSSIRPGDELALYEGIAEFRLASGVSLSIEGPAALVITSPSSLVLQHGKLTAYVPWGMADFKLTAGGCRINAADAEFGVNAAGDTLDMHVFSGKVIAEPMLETSRERELAEVEVIEREEALPADADFAKSVIVAGRGIALASRGGVCKVMQWHAADTTRFATKLSMAGPLPITKNYIDRVLESKPLDYWRFEEVRDEKVASYFEHGLALNVHGQLRLSGDSSNRAAELGFPGSDCYLVSEKPVPIPAGRHYSVEVWIKPSHAHDGSVALLISGFADPDQKQAAAFYLQLLRSGRRGMPADRLQSVRFLHRDPPGTSSWVGTDCYSRTPYLLRRWQHIVAVKDDEMTRLYVDGALSDERPDLTSIAEDLWLQLGQLGITDQRFRFIGQLDELAIYDRALSAEEVQKHYRAVQKQNRAKLKSST